MSQAPVREALRGLATLGFVEMEPYRGSRVRKPTKEEMTQAIEVRAELEALAGKLAAERRSEACLDDLERLYAEMLEAAERGDAIGGPEWTFGRPPGGTHTATRSPLRGRF